MIHTDEQLRRAAAKMLPEKLRIVTAGNVTSTEDFLLWKREDPDVKDEFVLDTEMLAVCQMIEEKLPEQLQNRYTSQLIFNLIGPDNQNLVVWEALTATWKQRITALAKVLNVEVV